MSPESSYTLPSSAADYDFIIDMWADCVNRGLSAAETGRRVTSICLAARHMQLTKYHKVYHTHTHRYLFIFLLLLLPKSTPSNLNNNCLTWLELALASTLAFPLSCSRIWVCACVWVSGCACVCVCIQIIVKGTACPWALLSGHVFAVEMGNHFFCFFVHAADFLLWFCFEIYIMWHTVLMLPHQNTHTRTAAEERHTRAKQRYRKCALLPIHNSQLTAHNSQFTICLKCLLGGSCQTQTKLIYARHRQTERERERETGREANSQSDRQTEGQRGRAGSQDRRNDSAHLDLTELKEVGPFLAFAFKRAVFAALLTPQQPALSPLLPPSLYPNN